MIPFTRVYFVDPEVSLEDEGEKCHEDMVTLLSSLDHFLEIDLRCCVV